MRLSTRSQYGIKALYQLARHQGEGPVSVKTIAEKEGLSEHYLEQLIAPLRKAGLVQSVRGAQGGYLLAKPPHRITVGEIVRALDGPVAPYECVRGPDVDPWTCAGPAGCVTHRVWSRVRQAVEEVLDRITLQDLVEESRERGGALMYYI